jgi:hypothetical protein
MTITNANRLDLVPVEGVELEDGQTIATRPPVWLRLEPSDLIARRRWVRLRYSLSMFDEPVRPLIRFTTATGKQIVEAMNGPVLGSAEWIGRVPSSTKSVEFSPCRREGPFGFRLDGVAAVSRLSLLFRGMARDPLWVPWAARSWVLKSRREAWQALKFGAAATPIDAYASWRAQFSRPVELEGLDRPRADWSCAPSFRFLVRLDAAGPGLLRRTIASLKEQIYPHWSLHLAVSAMTAAAAARELRDGLGDVPRLFIMSGPLDWQSLERDMSPSDDLAIIEPGDTLPDYALAILAEERARDPRLVAIYTDEDTIGHNGELSAPILKPDWSPIFNQGARYVGRLLFVRFKHVAGLGLQRLLTDEEGTLDQLLSKAARNEVGHVRRILYHRRARLPGDRTMPAN